MTENDVTEKGMKRGVRDSDIFLLFLTNSMLSRPFCLKEIEWALKMKKPIIVSLNQSERQARANPRPQDPRLTEAPFARARRCAPPHTRNRSCSNRRNASSPLTSGDGGETSARATKMARGARDGSSARTLSAPIQSRS